jgi:uncharacterized protein YbjT (DUF2867 family)
MTHAESTPLTVAVAGASGFVGRALIQRLLDVGHDVRALGRSVVNGEAWRGTAATGRRCDLFSLKDAEEALAGADVAVYLVHSMMPTARLTQAHFADMDAILADNFGRAAATAGISQIVYLGGLLPETEGLSEHLASRAEVERLLGGRGVPVTSLRAGLVVGRGGSSYRILERLVRRLPVLVCPRWTRTRTQPIALDDVVELITRSLGCTALYGRAFDVGGPDILTYRDMIARTAELLGLKRTVIDAPVLTPGLSTLWVSLVTGSERALVGPLVQSLRHDMVARDASLLETLGVTPTPFADAVVSASRGGPSRRTRPSPGADTRDHEEGGIIGPLTHRRARPDVRSIQRLPCPTGMDAHDIARAYLEWLPRFCWPWLHVDVSAHGVCRFEVAAAGLCLLELRLSESRSTTNRALLYITGGVLADVEDGDRDRLEFRVIDNGKAVLAAIHDFTPALPWFVYVGTQAPAHLIVMRAFARHLRRRYA